MIIFSAFDGMSCGRLALDKLGAPVDAYFASEVDKYAMQVSKANYSDIVQLGDITKVDASYLEGVDVLMGGSPCQGFSFTGKQKGTATKCGVELTSLEQYLKLKSEGFEFEGQSFLFWEFVRIWGELKPKYFLLENVRMSKKWQNVLSGVMGVEPIAINSSLVVGQNRPRLYWTNIPGVSQPDSKGLALSDALEDVDNNDYDISSGFARRVRESTDVKKAFTKIDPRVAGCMTARQYANWKGTLITRYPRGGGKVLRKMTPIECERLQTVPDGYSKSVSDTQRYRMLGNGWTVDVISHILSFIPKIGA